MSDDRDDFGYRENQTIIVMARREPRKAEVKVILLAENTPNFDKFIFKTDDGPWQESAVREIIWMMPPGRHKLSARVQTQYGWLGPVSTLEVYFKRRWI